MEGNYLLVGAGGWAQRPSRAGVPGHFRQEVVAGYDADLGALLSELGHDYLRPAGLDLRDSATLEELLAEAAGELQARADGGVL